MNRLSDYEAVAADRSQVYTLGEMLGDLRMSLWSELKTPGTRIDPFRRRLQRAWLSQADAQINPSPALVITPSATRTSRGRSSVNNDIRALVRGELAALDAELRAAIPRAADRTTRLHLIDAREEVKRILDPAG
jgi:hypothetical protein